MKIRDVVRAGVWAAILAGGAATAGAQPATPPQPRFAVQVPQLGFPDYFAPVLEQEGSTSGLSYYGRFLMQLPDWERQHPGEPAATALTLEFTPAGDGVTIRAFADFAPVDESEIDMPEYRKGFQKVAEYSARLNDAITLQELERIGLQPLVLKVVAGVVPPRVHATLINRAPSIQARIVLENRNSVMLSFQNNYPRAVQGIIVDDGSAGGFSLFGYRPVIESGATREQGFASADATLNPKIVLEAAVFVDGTAEGDPSAIARLQCMNAGYTLGWKRLIAVVDPILASPDGGEQAERIRRAVDELSVDNDHAVVEDVLAQSPDIGSDSVNLARAEFARCVSNAKRWLLRELDREKTQGDSKATFAHWWAKERNSYLNEKSDGKSGGN